MFSTDDSLKQPVPKCTAQHVPANPSTDWKKHLEFPSQGASDLARDFLRRLLCEPEDRLGYIRCGSDESGLGTDGVDQLMAHPWFEGMQWDTIHLETPPYRPHLLAEDDTRHFDDDIPDAVGGV